MADNKLMETLIDSYIVAFNTSIKNLDFQHSRKLIDVLESFTNEIKTIKLADEPKAVGNLLVEPEFATGVTVDEMREFAISYVRANGASDAVVVLDAFGKAYSERFTYDDMISVNNAPKWRRRMHQVMSEMRYDGTFMPHQYPYYYRYAFTPSYARLLKKANA